MVGSSAARTTFHLHSHLDSRFLGSEAPRSRAQVAEIIERYGITAMITLTEKFRDYRLPDVEQHHVPIAGCPTLEDVVQVVGIVEETLAQGGAAWVSCSQGSDRTGVMIAAVLVRHGTDVEDALVEVDATFPVHRRQPEYVALWEPYRRVTREYARMLAARSR